MLRRSIVGSIGCSGGLGARVTKGLGVSVENRDTSGRMTCKLRFIDTAVMDRISKNPHTHTPLERCKSKLNLLPLSPPEKERFAPCTRFGKRNPQCNEAVQNPDNGKSSHKQIPNSTPTHPGYTCCNATRLLHRDLLPLKCPQSRESWTRAFHR